MTAVLRASRTLEAFECFDESQRLLALHLERDRPADGDRLYEAVERAARAVVSAPAVTPADVRRKIEVLRRWYFADRFCEGGAVDDEAAGAMRHVFSDILAHLPD